LIKQNKNMDKEVEKINLKSKFQKFTDQWSPKVIGEMNDYQFKLVKIENDFTWHKHDDTDETFLVIEGKMGIEFEDQTVELSEGEMIVIPKGKKHKPYADKEAKIMIIEPKGVINTGDVTNDLTAKNDQWV
tara:strand:+ start:719 stop:1111 length:393 start_codon:yes stop_codon:yes gene_type:complete